MLGIDLMNKVKQDEMYQNKKNLNYQVQNCYGNILTRIQKYLDL